MTISIKPLGVQRFKYTQQVASLEWNIQHNLNKEIVICDTYVDNKLILPKSLEIVDSNTIKISWSIPVAGYAVIN